MNLPLFRKRFPRATSWKELREDILRAIEEEKRQETPPSIPSAFGVSEAYSIPADASAFGVSGAYSIPAAVPASGTVTTGMYSIPAGAASTIYNDATSV